MTRVHKTNYDAAYYEDIVERTAALPVEHQQVLTQWFDLAACPLPGGDARVLDAGCGPGPVIRFLGAYTQHRVGVDAFLYPLVQAKTLLPDVPFALCDLNDPLPFATASLDLITSYEVIEHLERAETFIMDSWRVLKPGGRLLLKTPNGWDAWRFLARLRKRWYWYADQDETHVRYFNKANLWRVLRRAGFVDITVRTGTRGFLTGNRRFNPRLPIVGHGLVASARKP